MPAISPKTPISPPDLPFMGDVSPALSNYLRNLSLWTKNQLAVKIDNQEAQIGNLFQGHDAPARTNPKVFKLQVSNAGVASLVPIPLGSPAAPTSVGAAVALVNEAPTDSKFYSRSGSAWAVPALANLTASNGAAAAPAGAVGELITSGLITGVAATSGTAATVTSIALTPGVWDLWATIYADTAAGCAMTALFAGVGVTAASLAAPLPDVYIAGLYNLDPSEEHAMPVGRTRIQISASATYFLCARALFSGGTLSFKGILSAARAG